MKVTKIGLVAGLSIQLAACSTIETLSFQKATNSGVLENQTVEVTYAPGAANSPYIFKDKGIPEVIETLCKEEETNEANKVAFAPAVAAALAVGAFDALLGAVDGYRARLKDRATKTYGATPVAAPLSLDAIAPKCIITERSVGKDGKNTEKDQKRLAMVMVNYLTRHPGGAGSLGLAWTVAYLRVDEAAAITGEVEGEEPTISLTETIAIAALQPRTGGGLASEIVSTASFNLKGIELGKGYIKEEWFPPQKSGQYYCPGTKKIYDVKTKKMKEEPAELCDEKLEPGLGAIFPTPRLTPTVGSINVTITERGSAADLKDAGAVEQGLRTAIRSALGKEIEARLSD